MYGQLEIWRMVSTTERALLHEQEKYTRHAQLLDAQRRPARWRSWLGRRPHLRTITVRIPLPVLAQQDCPSAPTSMEKGQG